MTELSGYGGFHSWDVLNEAVANNNHYDGESYMKPNNMAQIEGLPCKLFQKAREIRDSLNPGAFLVYNDWGHEDITEAKSQRVYDFVKDLVNNDCGIDGVGFQAHIGIDYELRYPNWQENWRSNIQRYGELGVRVDFTEIDVRACNYYSDCAINETDPNAVWTEHMFEQQAEKYEQLVEICILEPNCHVVQVWDMDDDRSNWDQTLPPANPYIFDDELNKKESFYRIVEKLNNFNRSHPSVISRLTGEWMIPTTTPATTTIPPVTVPVVNSLKQASAGLGIKIGSKLTINNGGVYPLGNYYNNTPQVPEYLELNGRNIETSLCREAERKYQVQPNSNDDALSLLNANYVRDLATVNGIQFQTSALVNFAESPTWMDDLSDSERDESVMSYVREAFVGLHDNFTDSCTVMRSAIQQGNDGQFFRPNDMDLTHIPDVYRTLDN